MSYELENVTSDDLIGLPKQDLESLLERTQNALFMAERADDFVCGHASSISNLKSTERLIEEKLEKLL